MDKMREDFEVWATESTDLWLMPVMFDGVFVNYYDENTADAFNVWKASRSALCVELPEFPEMETIADIDYAHEMPKNGWDEDQFSIWQKLQVAQRNKMQLFVYAKKLKAILSNGIHK